MNEAFCTAVARILTKTPPILTVPQALAGERCRSDLAGAEIAYSII
jgi:hypothetical protein